MEDMQMQSHEAKKKSCCWLCDSPKKSFWIGVCVGIAVFSILFLLVLATGLTKTSLGDLFTKKQPAQQQQQQTPSGMENKIIGQAGTFFEISEPVCKENGKPAIYMFSTSWCPHCQWAKPMFEKVMKEYINKGKIVAYNWELDINDNTLTTTKEAETPAAALSLYEKYNPQGSIPTFIFGCKYYRVGTGYEREGNKTAEEKEFRDLVEKLLLEK